MAGDDFFAGGPECGFAFEEGLEGEGSLEEGSDSFGVLAEGIVSLQ